MDRNAIALPHPPGLQAGDQLANESPGGVAGDGARRICDIDVNLAWNQPQFDWVVERERERLGSHTHRVILVVLGVVEDERQQVLRRDGDSKVGFKDHTVTATVADPNQSMQWTEWIEAEKGPAGVSEIVKPFGPTKSEAFPAGSPGRGSLTGFGLSLH